MDTLLPLSQAVALAEGSGVVEAIPHLEHAALALHGRADEPIALEALGRAYGKTGRFFEAVVVARRLLALRRRAVDDRGILRALALLVVALINAKATDRAERLREELGARLLDTPVDVEPHAHRVHLQALYSACLNRRDVEGAARHFQALRRQVEREPDPDVARWNLSNAEMYLALVSNDLSRGERVLARVLERNAPPNVYVPEVTLRSCLAMLLMQADRLEDARAQVRAALAWVEAAPQASEVLVDDAGQLAHLARTLLDDEETADRLLAQATAGLLERLHNLKTAAPLLQTLAEKETEQARQELVQDFQETILSFLAQVRPHAAHHGESEGLELVICAWCGSLRMPPGAWMPLAAFHPAQRTPRVSHGMCAACAERHGPD